MDVRALASPPFFAQGARLALGRVLSMPMQTPEGISTRTNTPKMGEVVARTLRGRCEDVARTLRGRCEDRQSESPPPREGAGSGGRSWARSCKRQRARVAPRATTAPSHRQPPERVPTRRSAPETSSARRVPPRLIPHVTFGIPLIFLVLVLSFPLLPGRLSLSSPLPYLVLVCECVCVSVRVVFCLSVRVCESV